MPSRTKKHNRNQNANYYQDGGYNVVCDRTGFKIKATGARMEWNSFFVRKESYEVRQPQDLIRGFPDRQNVDVPRPGTGDVFLATNEVTADDL